MEPAKSNLEPIESTDLDLEKKFLHPGKTEKSEQPYSVEVEKPIERTGAESEQAYKDVLGKIQQTDDQQVTEEVSKDAEHISQVDAESQVQHLVDVAMQKGVTHAIKVAKHMDDYYVMDTFHDQLLSEQLNQALREKGLVREI